MNAVRDGVRVGEFVSDVFEGGVVFLDDFSDLVNLNFDWGKRC